MTGIQKVTELARRYGWSVEREEGSKDVTLTKGDVNFMIAAYAAGSISAGTWTSPGRDPIVITGPKKADRIMVALRAPLS